jgi:hypothetical protein
VLGQQAPRTVDLPVPGPGGMRTMPIPLGAVMNTIAALAGQSVAELDASTQEDDPEVPQYLVNDAGDFIVDPANPEKRAALVALHFRVADEARRAGHLADGGPFESDEADESEAWAEEAGFFTGRT